MKSIHVLDANALTAFLDKEEGAEFIRDLFYKANEGEITIYMHKVNFIEVLYYVYRFRGKIGAIELFNYINELPIKLIEIVSKDIMFEASRLKANYPMSLADSIGLATAIIYKGYFVTADYHELEIVKKREKLNIKWFRPKKVN